MVALKIILPLLCFALVFSDEQNGTDIFHFTRRLMKSVLKEPRNWGASILISPFAMEFALGVISLGASGNSLEEITNIAGTNLLETSDHKRGYAKNVMEGMRAMTKGQVNVRLQTSVILAINTDYIPSTKFMTEARNWYNAEIQPLRFEWQYLAASNLSDYISDQTDGRIKNLVQTRDFDSYSPMIAASYVDVSVKWLTRFDDRQTLMGQFHTIYDTKQPKEMMIGQFFTNITHNPELHAKILRLPLQGGNLTMTFVLPDRKAGIKDLIKKIDQDVESFLFTKNYPFKLVPTHVVLPKLKIENSLNGKKLLKKMGIRQIFKNDAGLENIAIGDNFRLTELVQKSVVQIDEWGINAASATQANFQDAYDASEDRTLVQDYFVADHPFLYTMTIQPREDILFFGVYGGD